MKVRPATPEDIEEIVRLRREAAEWLSSIGSDQWSEDSIGIDFDEFVRRVRRSITAGETWVVTDHSGQVAGTIAIDRHTNPGLWTESEQQDSLFIHRMIRDRRAEKGVGKLLLDNAMAVARQVGARSLKLDAWTTNTDLHRYYESQGFRHVRTVHGHHTASAALFERPVDTPEDNDKREADVRNTP